MFDWLYIGKRRVKGCYNIFSLLWNQKWKRLMTESFLQSTEIMASSATRVTMKLEFYCWKLLIDFFLIKNLFYKTLCKKFLHVTFLLNLFTISFYLKIPLKITYDEHFIYNTLNRKWNVKHIFFLKYSEERTKETEKEKIDSIDLNETICMNFIKFNWETDSFVHWLFIYKI